MAEENIGVASEYYSLASFVCLAYLLENGIDDSLYKKGKEAAKKAIECQPEEYDYQLFNLYYRILAIQIDNLEAEKSFAILQQIQKECPPFHIIKNALFNVEWMEEVYNELFEITLRDVYIELEEAESEHRKEAALLLKALPSPESKLLAFYALSEIFLKEGQTDEALRNAKLGVEVLGSNVEYDYHEFSHWLWGECWALVGIINREKKEYDFAEGVLEKGARFGILSCMIPLAEMYENGESDDPDPDAAEKYRHLAKSIQESRDREKEAEEERIRIEEEKKRKEIEEHEKAIELEKERKKREEEINNHKSWLRACIAVLSLTFIVCVVNLCQKDILDSVAKSLKRGDAIVELKRTTEQQYALIMNNKDVVYKDLHKERRILKVGEQYPVRTISLRLNNGLKVIKEETDDTFSVISSKWFNIRRVSERCYLVTPQRIKNPLDTKAMINNSYLIVLSNTGQTTVLKIPKGSLDGAGNIIMTFKDSILPVFQTDFLEQFNKNNYAQIVDRHYCDYSADIVVTLSNGSAKIENDVSFPLLGISCVASQLDSDSFKQKMAAKIKEIFRAEYEDGLFKTASKLTGVVNRSQMRLSSDDRYTFVIANNYYSGKNSTALLSVNNVSKKVTVLDAGMQVLFKEYSIYVKRHTTFLLFFNSSEDVYYDYLGKRL